MSRNITSIIAGSPAPGPTGARITSTNPARTSDVVAEVSLGDASTFVAAARAAREAQQAWADVPAPVRGRSIAHIGRVVEANAESLARLVRTIRSGQLAGSLQGGAGPQLAGSDRPSVQAKV